MNYEQFNDYNKTICQIEYGSHQLHAELNAELEKFNRYLNTMKQRDI